MYKLKKSGKVFRSKFVGTGPSSYEKKNLPGRGLTEVEKYCFTRTPKYVLLLPTKLNGRKSVIAVVFFSYIK